MPTMKFPSWNNFADGLVRFEQYIYGEKAKVIEKVDTYKEKYPIVDEIFKNAIPFLPVPFNAIAQIIYNNFQGRLKTNFSKF